MVDATALMDLEVDDEATDLRNVRSSRSANAERTRNDANKARVPNDLKFEGEATRPHDENETRVPNLNKSVLLPPTA